MGWYTVKRTYHALRFISYYVVAFPLYMLISFDISYFEAGFSEKEVKNNLAYPLEKFQVIVPRIVVFESVECLRYVNFKTSIERWLEQKLRLVPVFNKLIFLSTA